jgi:hypothetical protein
MCDCQNCLDSREFDVRLAELPEHLRAYFAEQRENFALQGADLSHANAVIEGSWPSADDTIAGSRAARAERLKPGPHAVVVYLKDYR